MTDQIKRAPVDVAHFDEILQHLLLTRGFDLTAYKRSTLLRRITRRMQTLEIPTFEAYYDYLQVRQDELGALFNTILINVTSFFRDPDVWTYIADDVLPELLDRQKDGVVRIWSAGCAAGHEPYTLAMLLAERIGEDALRTRVKIYATDVDEEALAEARAAVYTSRQVADVPPELAAKYFDRVGVHFAVRRELRRAVIFGRHDLAQDAPISRVDLLVCRNTLMYFNADAQSRILARFYFAVNPGGYVLLGRAEMLFSHDALFTAADLKRRLFRTVPKPSHRDRLLLLMQPGRDIMPNMPSNQVGLREAAFESDTIPHIVLDAAGALAAANGPARDAFGLTQRDVGRPLPELEVSYRPVELRATIARVAEDGRDITLKDVPWQRGGSDARFFDVTVALLRGNDGAALGTRISYRDVTELKSLQEQLRHSKGQLEAAYEELQSTNEELETTNEELQSTVEELETTNEELQSTNEELETMNEELQSTNEELQTMNDELRNRSLDLNSANVFLESVFVSLRWGVVVLDCDFRVQVWNQRAADLWGLRVDEAYGADFLQLDIGLPVADLEEPIRAALGGDRSLRELVLPAVNRRGRAMECRVSIAALRQWNEAIRGVILMMEESTGGAAKQAG